MNGRSIGITVILLVVIVVIVLVVAGVSVFFIRARMRKAQFEFRSMEPPVEEAVRYGDLSKAEEELDKEREAEEENGKVDLGTDI